MKSPKLFITLLIVLCLTISIASAACNDGFCYGTHNSHQNWNTQKNIRTHTGNRCQTCSGSSGVDFNCFNSKNCYNCNDGNNCPGFNSNCIACSSSCPNGNSCTECNCDNCNNCYNCNDGNNCPGCNCNSTSSGSSGPNGNNGNSGTTPNQPPETDSSGVTSYNPHEGNIYEVGGNGQRLILTNYANATDPTYQQLLDFIKADKTDELTYTNTFVCSDFAEVLHNNAEKAGIKCAWVGCDFTYGEGHAFNEFNTTDKGTMYIDCTGVPNPNANQDKILNCVIGQPLTAKYLFRSDSYSAGNIGIVKQLHIFW